MFIFWITLLAPWILDGLGGRGVQTTLFGAGLWGLLLGIATARAWTRDPKLQRLLITIYAFGLGGWISYWVLAFAENPAWTPIHMESRTLTWLTWLHAGFLAAGVGIVFLLLVSAILWIIQDARLRQSSWARRGFRWKGASLEAVAGMCERAARAAVLLWSLGFLIALVSGVLEWEHFKQPVSWWHDSRVYVSAFMTLLLACAFQLSFIRRPLQSLYWIYVTLCLCFLTGFGLLASNRLSQLHEPLNWFVGR
jgi:hypothetical protein